MSGAGRTLERDVARRRRARELLAVRGRRATGTRPRSQQALGFPVCFVPHLLPVRRGLLATCYVRRRTPTLRALLEAAYAGSPVVRVLPGGRRRPRSRACRAPTPPRSASSPTRATGTTIVICAIDNLGKGAAGQAVQNANLALGLAETAGLRLCRECSV